MINKARIVQFAPWIAILILGVTMVFFNINQSSLWYDESYSAAAVEHPLIPMVSMISRDAHPPLYFVLLKLFTSVFGRSVSALRALSALAVIALAALGFFPLRKICGTVAAAAFSLLVLFTPISVIAAQDARMYSLVAFFVTAMILWGYLAFSENKIANWILLSVFTLCAAYTHYFGMLAAFAYWGTLAIAVFARRQKREILTFLASGAAVIVLYSPWFYSLFVQVSHVSENYWIPPVNAMTVVHTLSHFYMAKFSWGVALLPFAVFLMVFSAAVAGCVIFFRRKDQRFFLVLSSLSVFTLTLAGSVILSLVFRPILVDRYMISCIGALLLAFACTLSIFGNRAALASAVAVYALLNLPTLVYIYRTPANGPMNEIRAELRDRVKPGDIFVHGSEHNLGTFYYYFPENRHYLYIPDDFVPFSNYEVFSKHATTGGDMFKYVNEPVTLWVTTRPGEYYTMKAGDIARAPKRRLAAAAKQYSKAPGWFRVSVMEVLYDPDVEAQEQLSGSGTLTIKLRGFNADTPGKVYYTLFDSEPFNENNMYISGEAGEAASEMTIKLEALTYGDYALMVFHDTNNNMRPDFDANGMPLEGICYPEALGGVPQSIDFETLKLTFDAQNTEWNFGISYGE